MSKESILATVGALIAIGGLVFGTYHTNKAITATPSTDYSKYSIAYFNAQDQNETVVENIKKHIPVKVTIEY